MMVTFRTRLLAVLPLLALCSCRGVMPRGTTPAVAEQQAVAAQQSGPWDGQTPAEPPARPVVAAMHSPPSLPPTAWTGPSQHDNVHGTVHDYGPCPHCQGARQPFAFTDDLHGGLSWVPDGIACPWPRDEFICDGGDLNHDVLVKNDWTVVGLDQEDTVAHYDTVDGRTEVTASNCVCIYAPRFAAVRQITSPVLHEGHERMAGIEKPVKLNVHEERRGPNTAVQPEMVVAQLGLDSAPSFRERTRSIGVEQATTLVLAAEAFLPHEDLLLIQRGQFDNHEKARLAERVAAAVTWTENRAVQIILDGKPAVEAKGLAKPQETIVYELDGHPRLRICKIADKSEAQVGEIITFTLRFDNVGDQKIGNVTIIDHLMPRLEYVEGSTQSSVKAEFKTEPKLDGETLVLRWEVLDPLEVNQGGVIRFQARVR